MAHAFSFLQADLEWLERALAAVIDDWNACSAEEGWNKFWAREELVRAAERSVRRKIKVYHCVFGERQSCRERTVSNCDACIGMENTAARALIPAETGAA